VLKSTGCRTVARLLCKITIDICHMNQVAVMRLFIGDPGRESSERKKVHANAGLLHAETSPKIT
jgi:hypothetical protein